MKDYYEILGVEEEATQEEVRARWAELTKLYHPDVQQSPEDSDRIKEINEAYQVLKEYSTRLEYDLERALRRSILRRGEQRKRERLRWEKILLAAGLAAILIGAGSFLFFFKSPQVAWGPIRGKILETAAVTEREMPKTPEKPGKSEESEKTRGLQEPKKPMEAAKVVPREPVKVVVPEPVRVADSKKPEKAVKPERPKEPEKPVQVAKIVPREPVKVVAPKPDKVVELKKPEKGDRLERPKEPEKPVEAAKVAPREPVKVAVPEPVRVAEPKESEKKDKPERPKEPEKPAEMAKVVSREPVKVAVPEPVRVAEPKKPEKADKLERPKEPAEAPKPILREPAKAVAPELARVIEPEKTKTPAKPSVSGEEEVKRFFSRYQARYNDKDLEGFLSFFSSRAIQNQKYGMDRIRKIYTHFFEQSQELQYQIRNMQVEPNPKGVEVKARYELGQVLKEGGEKKVWRGQIRWILAREEEGFKILSLDYQHQK